MKLSYWTLALLFFGYVVIRAVNIPFTVDEAWTYLIFIKAPFWDIVTSADPSSNNHILNTLLSKFCFLFSSSELSLRLPNVLGFILYLYSSYKISTLFFRNSITGLLFFTSLLFSQSLLQFFSLCRGYGLGISFLTYSIYQLLAFARSESAPNNKRIHLSCSFAVLAAYSNFSLLPALVSIFIAGGLLMYNKIEGSNRLLKTLKIPFLYSGLLCVLIGYPLYRMTSTEQFYFGGSRDFVRSTLQSMLENIAPHLLYTHYRPLLTVAVALIVFSITIPLVRFIRITDKYRPEFIAPFILLITVIIINLQFYIFHTGFVQYRTAVYLYPLIILAFFSSIKIIGDRNQQLSIVSGAGAFSFLGFYFFVQMNITSTKDWWFDAYNKKVLQYAAQYKFANRKIKLYAAYMSSNSFNYYIDTRYNNLIEYTPCCIENIKDINLHSYDFVYLENTVDFTAYPEFKIVQAYRDSTFYLYAKKSE